MDKNKDYLHRIYQVIELTKIIENYINNLTIEKTNEIALKNNIKLNIEELNFIYSFLKTNAIDVLNQRTFNFEQYKNRFTNTNYIKIKDLIDKYSSYL